MQRVLNFPNLLSFIGVIKGYRQKKKIFTAGTNNTLYASVWTCYRRHLLKALKRYILHVWERRGILYMFGYGTIGQMKPSKMLIEWELEVSIGVLITQPTSIWWDSISFWVRNKKLCDFGLRPLWLFWVKPGPFLEILLMMWELSKFIITTLISRVLSIFTQRISDLNEKEQVFNTHELIGEKNWSINIDTTRVLTSYKSVNYTFVLYKS